MEQRIFSYSSSHRVAVGASAPTEPVALRVNSRIGRVRALSFTGLAGVEGVMVYLKTESGQELIPKDTPAVYWFKSAGNDTPAYLIPEDIKINGNQNVLISAYNIAGLYYELNVTFWGDK